jgi:hypothetical protein
MYDSSISRSDAAPLTKEDVAGGRSKRMGGVSNKPWGSISQADYPTAESYCSASLINENTGPRSGWTKDKCKLPVHEPGGALNANGVHAAAARLAGAGGGVSASPAAKKAAARKLVGHYRSIGATPPDSITRMGGY